MSEIELKLWVPAKDLSKAQRILTAGSTRHRPAQRTLTSVYYDTPGRDLQRRDLTLRVRREGRRFIQTVKAENLGGQDPLRRGEWEDPIDGGQPELAAPESGDQLPSSLKPDQLRPVFSTVVQLPKIQMSDPLLVTERTQPEDPLRRRAITRQPDADAEPAQPPMPR